MGRSSESQRLWDYVPQVSLVRLSILALVASCTASGRPVMRPSGPSSGVSAGQAESSASAFGGQTASSSSALEANAVRLAIGDRETLPLRGMQMRVQIDGFRARVVIDSYFLNDRSQNYEGTFQLRLPDGATPYFFAFGETTFRAADGQGAAIPFFS